MAKTIRLTCGQAVAKFLQNQYSERDGREQRLICAVFGIFGHGNAAGLGQGFMQCCPDIAFHQPFHEQEMVHTAVAYARAKRRLSTFACTSSIGPGTANMYTGAAGATIQRVPVLLLPSDHYATRRQGVVLQQLEHPISPDIGVTEGLRCVSTYFDRVTRPEQIISSLMEAMRVLTSPAEAGAVTVAICQDVQTHAFDYPEAFFDRRVWRVARRPAEADDITRLVDMLHAAKAPLIISGGGVLYSEAEAELLVLAEALGIPVAETIAGRSTMPGESAMALGGIGMVGTSAANDIAARADLVLAVGTRLSDCVTCSQTLFHNPDVRFASINVTGRDAIKQGAHAVVSDAKVALAELINAARQAGIAPGAQWVSDVGQARAAWDEQVAPSLAAPESGAMTQSQALAMVNETLGANSVTVAAAGSLPGDVHKLWQTDNGRKVHLEFGFSCMTYEISAGIGLAMSGEYDDVCVCIGDGTYLMNPGPVITAVRENLNLTIIIFVNDGYQVIRSLQLAKTGHGYATEFRGSASEPDGDYLAIDYVQNAASLGAQVFAADDVEGFRTALADGRACTGVRVIAVRVDRHQMSVAPLHGFWDIEPPEVSTCAQTQNIRAAYEDAVKAHRYHV